MAEPLWLCHFLWCGWRDCDSRRELRALVVRRENSSTGRVFYTAPTSNPVALTMQKHPDKKSRCFHIVRMTGFEPTRISSLEPETSASAVPPHPRIKCKMQNAECKIVNSQFLHGKETRSGAYSSDKSYFSACSTYYLRICALIWYHNI